jgi:hypothetical protein
MKTYFLCVAVALGLLSGNCFAAEQAEPVYLPPCHKLVTVTYEGSKPRFITRPMKFNESLETYTVGQLEWHAVPRNEAKTASMYTVREVVNQSCKK